ncbi:hypothetical protein [Luteimonas saliphila]|uniref:hypothetical protein n=1 Tax=Luteimonas saliphila TaxID=2804919 RepID=UPI00192D9415|nr:hypothetical protein [Luteimonas saliphila]
MEKQTLIFTALPNGYDADGRALLSVLVSPRLWTDSAAASLPLSLYPDLLQWPDRVAAIDWRAEVDGGAPLPLDVVAGDHPLQQALWSALFRDDTPVRPYRFDDYRGTPIESFPVWAVHDLLSDLYGRASADPAYGAGAERPALEVLAADPDITAVAEPWLPDPEPEWVTPGTAAVPHPDAPPVEEQPDVWPQPPAPDDDAQPGGCGCLTWPLRPLRWLLHKLFGWPSPWAEGGVPPVQPEPPTSAPLPTPSFDTSVTPPVSTVVPEVPKAFIPPLPATAQHQARRAAFDALDAFLRPFPGDDVPLPDAAAIAEEWDFHQAIAALGDFPAMLRRLGMVIDLRLPDGQTLPASGTVRVLATGVSWSPGTTPVSPRTHFRADAGSGRFVAAPRPSAPEIVDGFLRVDDAARFRIVQNDVVADANKLRNAATRFFRFGNKADRPPGAAGEAGLPALRTAGISLVRREAAGELAGQFLRSCALNRHVVALDGSTPPQPVGDPPPPADDELYAEDLVRGYRIDVFDAKTGHWRSLCERIGQYRFLDAQPGPVTEGAGDEGFVQLAATEPRDPSVPRSLRIGETLFTWDGWSLCASRPGLAIMPDDSHEDPANEAATPFRIEADFKARPGSLPRLRFGRKYRLRARVADLAGNSVVDPDDPAFADDGPAVTDEFTAVRYEPVAPPVVMLRQAPIEGESLERMVIRTPASGPPRSLTARHVAPPKTAQLMAELHGAIDGGGFDGSLASHQLSARESNSVQDDALQALPDVEPPSGAPPPAIGESSPWIQPADYVSVRYLPDPQARGVLFEGLPGETAVDGMRRIDFDGAWPDALPLRIELQAIAQGQVPAQPAWQPEAGGGPGSGVLAVQLAPAQRAVVRFNSALDGSEIGKRGVWEWTEQQAPSNLADVRGRFEKGRHWAHLPWRELVMVHAVQKPLAAPAVASILPQRAVGWTCADIGGTFEAERASTGRLQLDARWTDWVDDPDMPEPGQHERGAMVGESPVPVEGAGPLPFHDANRQAPATALLRQEFHDTRYHKVAYTPVAMTRFREYFPPSSNTVDATTLAGATVAVDVPNTARPAPPKFLYALPLFHWDTPPGTPGVLERTREVGLRVYLDRPWYSSGDGELLGVVFLDGEPFPDPEDPRARFATVWGGDPVWSGRAASGQASGSSFVGAADTRGNLTLPGEGNETVSVAGYEPVFDKQRRLWRADLRIAAGDAYWPFVRMALARFQPHSIDDAHLSAVHRTDFIQIPPRRHAVLQVAAPTVGILVAGPAPVASEASSGFRDVEGSNGLNEIEAVVERLTAGGDPGDPLSWQRIESTRVLLLQEPSAPGVWEGELTLSEPLAPGAFRVALREYEWFRTDDLEPGARSRSQTFARRLVYADVFALPDA